MGVNVIGDPGFISDDVWIDEVASAICKVQDNQKLKEELVDRERSNVKRFAWDTRAELYWEAIMK